jgi:hypothetical protein
MFLILAFSLLALQAYLIFKTVLSSVSIFIKFSLCIVFMINILLFFVSLLSSSSYNEIAQLIYKPTKMEDSSISFFGLVLVNYFIIPITSCIYCKILISKSQTKQTTLPK